MNHKDVNAVEQIEREYLTETHWSLRGEAGASARPYNSLLEMDLDLPMTHFAQQRALGDAEAEEIDSEDETSKPTPKITKVIFDILRQRIKDNLFDDPEPPKAIAPAVLKNAEKTARANSTLNFEKSTVGLAELYQKQYLTEVCGAKTDQEVEESENMTQAKKAYTDVMYMLDCLTNSHYVPHTPLVSTEELKPRKKRKVDL